MGSRVAGKKQERKIREADSAWESVVGNMDKLIGVRVSRIEIEKRIGGLKGTEGELSGNEAKSLPLSAEYAANLRDALDSRSLRKIDGVA